MMSFTQQLGTKLAIDGGQPVRTKTLPYGRQYIDDADIQTVVDVLKGDFLTTGPTLKAFEEKLAATVGARYAVAFSNGTAALHGACFAAGIGAGDEVITTPMTFAASANCVLYMGGTPVFADIDPVTYNIDPADVERKITQNTKAIIPVDYTGQPVNLDEMRALAKKHGLIVIEDAAHALGATYKGESVGGISDMTMFSLHPVKAITTGEGGVITTNNTAFYERLLLFRTHGITRNPELLVENHGPWYYEMLELGYNYRLTDVQAALGSSQLDKLQGFLARRNEIVQQYNEAFAGLEGVVTPHLADDRTSGWHLYVLRLQPEHLTANRRQVFEALQAEGLGVNLHYIPVYYHPYYKQLGYEKGICPNAEKLYEEIITLPLFPAMDDQDIRDVIQAVTKVVQHYTRSEA